MILCESVSKEISANIAAAGGYAVGLSGRDNKILQCVQQESDEGLVGKLDQVNRRFLRRTLLMDICLVVSPIGTGMGDEAHLAYNVNADVAAGRISGELDAALLVFLTDTAGVLDKNKELLPRLSVQDVNRLIANETISGGMIRTVSYATNAVQLGAKGAYITDGSARWWGRWYGQWRWRHFCHALASRDVHGGNHHERMETVAT